MKILAGKQLTRSSNRVSQRNSTLIHSTDEPYLLSTFNTALGWMGLLGQGGEIVSVYSGHSSAKSVQTAATKMNSTIGKSDWNPEVRGMLESYAEGEFVDFSHVDLRLPSMTPFRQLIISATRQVRYGETTTYGELAKRIGHQGAARAVGTVMSTNCFPIIIPCHRVLSAGGNIGGYTSPAGLDLKRRMLYMEEQGSGASISNRQPKWMLAR